MSEERVPISAHRVNWKLTSISRKGELYHLKYDTPEGPVEVQARTVALTVPAYTAADLLNSAAVRKYIIIISLMGTE